MKKLIVHLVSESSGQTVRHAANTALAKFSDVDVKKYHWPMTRNLKMLEEVFFAREKTKLGDPVMRSHQVGVPTMSMLRSVSMLRSSRNVLTFL